MQILQVSEKTLRDWDKAGKISAKPAVGVVTFMKNWVEIKSLFALTVIIKYQEIGTVRLTFSSNQLMIW